MNCISSTDFYKVFGKIFREARIKSGYTQERAAETLGLSLKYISRIENGNSGVKTQNLINAMNLFNIPPQVIYKEFLVNKDLKKDIELFEKITKLSNEKKLFISAIINLVKNL